MYPVVGTQRVALDRDSMGLRVNARNDTNAWWQTVSVTAPRFLLYIGISPGGCTPGYVLATPPAFPIYPYDLYEATKSCNFIKWTLGKPIWCKILKWASLEIRISAWPQIAQSTNILFAHSRVRSKHYDMDSLMARWPRGNWYLKRFWSFSRHVCCT